MKNKCNFKLVLGFFLTALIFVSCTDDEIVSNDKLVFNKVLNFSYKTEIVSENQTITTLTVPTNMIWKIESAALYFDDKATTNSSSALTMNQFVILRQISSAVHLSNPYLTQGDYKLILNLHQGEVDSRNFGYSSLSIIEYKLN